MARLPPFPGRNCWPLPTASIPSGCLRRARGALEVMLPSSGADNTSPRGCRRSGVPRAHCGVSCPAP
eukprot:5078831-Lingulodinium_polyedra.AAC.1